MVHPSVPAAYRAQYYQLLYKWAPIIAVSLEDLSTPANVPPMTIRTFGQPVAKPPMRYSPAHRTFIAGEVRDARAANLIYRGASPWSAPCFAVPKPRSNDLRLVLDYRFLNS